MWGREWDVRSAVPLSGVGSGVEWSGERGVEWSGVGSGEWGVRSGVDCGVVSAEWSGLWSGQCGVE